MAYTGQEVVKRMLRDMSDDDLKETYRKGLREVFVTGPPDGDRKKSEFLLDLVVREYDIRFMLNNRKEQ